MAFPKRSRPNRPQLRHRAKINAQYMFKRLLSHISWLLLGMILIASVLDSVFWHSHYVISKSIAIGALLNGLTHLLFAWAVFRQTGSQARRHIVNNLYLGQMLKWVVTLVGFVLIFILVKPLSAIGLFFGFIMMQGG